MNTTTSETVPAGAQSVPVTNQHKQSTKDSTWFKRKSWEKNLVQHTATGTFYARLKVAGKTIRVSLDTDVYTTATLRLADKKKQLRKRKAASGTFAEARALYEANLERDHTIKPESKHYRMTRIAALLKSWPELDSSKVLKIKEADCKDWAQRFSAKFDEQNFNNTLSTLRLILERGGLTREDNPAYKVPRLGVRPTVLELPDQDQFEKLLECIESAGAPQSKDCADLVRFLAFSGCRIGEARKVTWGDIDSKRGMIRVWNGKRSLKSQQSETRDVPIIQDMRDLLQRLEAKKRQQTNKDPEPTDRVCVLGECEKSLTRACKAVGIARLTHHDLRHMWATRCIECGVDIPTVSSWLGHSDGGALAMRVYRHHRDRHSAAMGAKVTFGQPKPANVIPMPQANEAS